MPGTSLPQTISLLFCIYTVTQGHIGYRMPLARQLLSSGLGILLLEYRGYGGNEGKPTEEGLYIDGRTAIHFLQAKGIPSCNIVLFGESLGSGVATQLATDSRFVL